MKEAESPCLTCKPEGDYKQCLICKNYSEYQASSIWDVDEDEDEGLEWLKKEHE